LLLKEGLSLRSCGVGFGESLRLVVAVQVLQDKALAVHGCAEGRDELERVIEHSQRLLVPIQMHEGPPFANPAFRGLRIKAH
jgi:hypothetical protein